ncbi:hypothetical protein [Streptomyces sp. NPDC126503]|uniref:hypothetical protein n=1 Tax=Streptomyces sp. NPDC126503 TaxID=3155315 RepID=UPI00332B28E0
MEIAVSMTGASRLSARRKPPRRSTATSHHGGRISLMPRAPTTIRATRLLEQWRSQVDGLRGAGGTAYLPYEFSDECTGWLRVSSAEGHNAEVQAGWTMVSGWSFTPSDYLETAQQIADFEPEANARIECFLDDLSQRITTNAETLTASRQ